MIVILGIIEEAEKGAFKDSVYGIERAANLVYSMHTIDGVTKEYTFLYENQEVSNSDENVTLDFKGEIPKWFRHF